MNFPTSIGTIERSTNSVLSLMFQQYNRALLCMEIEELGQSFQFLIEEIICQRS